MGIRSLPFFKGKKGWQFAGGGLSAEGDELPVATDSTAGIVQPDGSTIGVDSNGVISVINNFTVANNAGAHNSIYRGQSLGTSVTDAQYSAIQAGTFANMFIGDYWTIDNVTYRIAAFDFWLNTGDTACTVHHVLIVPDENFTAQKMNDSNTTTGGYVGSKMYTTNLSEVKTAIRTAFGSTHILSHREMLTKAVDGSGNASSWGWYDSDIELMNEQMAYGGPCGSKPEANSINYNMGIDKSQLPLFVLEPSRIINGSSWWLRSVGSATNFAYVNGNGIAANSGASDAIGIRPVFAIYNPTV